MYAPIILLIIGLILKWIYKVYKEEVSLKTAVHTTQESLVFSTGMRVEVAQRIKNFLDSSSILYTHNEEAHSFLILFQNSEEEPELRIQIEIEEYYITFNALYYEDVPDNKITQVVELIARINVLILIGHVNFYYEDRLAVYQSYLLFPELELSNDLLDNYLTSCIRLFDRFSPALRRVIDEEDEPLIAILDLELSH